MTGCLCRAKGFGVSEVDSWEMPCVIWSTPSEGVVVLDNGGIGKVLESAGVLLLLGFKSAGGG